MKRLLSIALALVATLSIQAATFTVNTFADDADKDPLDGICEGWSGSCSLRAAIMQANYLAGADTVIVPPGTYTIIDGAGEDLAESGDLDIWESLTIVGANGNPGGDPSATIIQARTTAGTYGDRIFHVVDALPGTRVTIQAMTLRNAYSPALFDSGGAIAAQNADALTLSNLVIEQSRVRYGQGGALSVSQIGTVTIEKSIIRSSESNYGEGGAITIAASAVTIRDSVISGNRTPEGNGGAIRVVSGSLAIVRSLIANNFANEGGGAIYSAGAVPITVADSTFSGNSANLSGGAVNLAAGSFDATNVTFAGNTSNGGSGGGIANDGGTVVLTNTILANDPSPFGSLQDISGTVSPASSNNIIGSSSSGGLTHGVNGNQVGVDPRLAPLADNGGATQTHALLLGSPAIDAGTNAAASTFDQRGAARVADSSDSDAIATVDIGAYETYPTISDMTDRSGIVGLPIAVPFYVGDASFGLTITAVSSNQAVVPNANLVLSNTGTHNPTLTVTGASAGTATIVVRAAHGAREVSDTFDVTFTGAADLTITKTHEGTLRQGVSGTYTLTVANIGSLATSGTVTVTDVPSPLMIATALSGSGWSCSLATLTCTRSDALAAGASWPPITLTVDLPQGGTLTNDATVSGGGDAVLTNNSASDTTFVTPASELEVTIAGPAALTPGESSSHTVDIRNLGPSGTSRVNVIVNATAGISYTGASLTGFTCSWSPTSVMCEGGLLGVGASATLTATFTVDPTAAAQVTINARTLVSNDFTQTKNSDTHTITIVRDPDLTIAKAHAGTFRQGGTGDYTITVTNSGSGPTSAAVTVTDSLPAGLTATAMSGSGWTCDLAALTCTRSDVLAAGGSFPPITLSVSIDADAPADVVNLANVSGGGETATGNNEAMDGTTIIQVADLVPSVTDGGGSFSQGDDGRIYEVYVQNEGSAMTDAPVSIAMALSPGITFDSVTPSAGWTCTAAPLVCSTSDPIWPGAGFFLAATIAVDVAVDAPTTVSLTATVSGGGEVVTSNSVATDTTPVVRMPDLVITKTHEGDLVQGGVATYTIRVGNVGSGTNFNNVVVTDVPPAELAVTAIGGQGWSCDLPSLTCIAYEPLAPGASYPGITLTGNVSITAPPTITNTATVSGTDRDTSNNTATDAAAVRQNPDMFIEKRSLNVTWAGMSGAEFRLLVWNIGSGPSAGEVVVTEIAPPELTITSMSGNGWTCDTTTCRRSDSLAPGTSWDPIQVLADVAPAAAGLVKNVATVSGGGELAVDNNAADATIFVRSFTFTPDALPPAQVAVAYDQQISVSGNGVAPYSFSVTEGTLPMGITLAPDGRLSGVPVESGSFTVTIQSLDSTAAVDWGPFPSWKTYTLTVAQPTIVVAPATLPDGAFGVAYSQGLSAAGGIAPYSFALSSGALPDGLTLAANGVLSGSPAQAGTFSFAITATDSTGGAGPHSGTRGYSFAIAQAPTTTSITSAPITFGDTASVTVTVASGAGGTPAGNVTVTIDGTTTLTEALSGGAATFSIPSLSAGSRTLEATYSGDTNYLASSGTTTLQVSRAAPWFTIDAPAIVFGSDAAILVTATGGAATGPVDVTIDGTTSTLPLVDGSAAFTFPGVNAGNWPVTLAYAGDANFTAGSASAMLRVEPASTTMTIGAPSIVYGNDGVVTVTVSSAAGNPPGDVSLTVDGGTVLVQPLLEGVATFTVPALDAGDRALVATYTGETNFGASTGTSTLHVEPASTTTSVVAPSIVYGNDGVVTVTVSSAAGTPAGNVSLTVDGAAALTQPLVAGVATFTLAAPGAGDHSLVATYDGALNFASSNATAALTVAKAPASVAIVAVAPSPSLAGESVTVTFTLDASEGDVTISAGAYACTAAASAGNCTITFNEAGSYDLVATYDGTANYEPSASAPFTHVVEHPIGDAIVTGDATICAGEEVTLTAELTGTAPWTLTWSDGLVETATSATHRRTVRVDATTVFTLTSASDAHRAMTIAGSAAITVRDPLAAPVIEGPARVEPGASFTLEASRGYDSYQWYRDGRALANATTRRLEIAAAGDRDLASYTVVGFVDGCVSPLSRAFAVEAVENEAATLIATIVGSADGANGSRFRSALHLFNRSDAPFEGSLSFVKPSAGGGAAATMLELLPKETRWYGDLFGGSGLASADLAIQTGAAPLGLVHVYNDLGENGTTGLLQPLLDASRTLAARDRAVLIAPADPVATRFNIGIRTLQHGASLRYIVRDASGAIRATAERIFPPSFFAHMSAVQFTGVEPGPSDSIELELTGGGAIVYGASTDNVTNDPNIQFAQRVMSSGDVRRVIPVVGSTAGAFGSRFRTSLQLFNGDDASRSASIVVRPHGITQTFTIEPQSTLAIDDLLPAMGLEGLGTADLVSSPAIAAVVRVFNDGEGETSMTEELVDETQILETGDVATLLAPHDPSQARFNIGIRALEEGATLALTVRSPQGVVLATRELVLGAHHFQHTSAFDATGHAFTGDESVSVSVISGRAVAYGVWTDNVTNDPGFHVAQ